MKKMAALLAGAALMFAASSAMAITLDPSVPRQVAINAPYTGEGSLQSELNTLFGQNKVDAATDQLGVGMFQVSTAGSAGFMPQLKFEWTANSGKQNVGIFSWNGTEAVRSQIFSGGNNVGDIANVIWQTENSGVIITTDFGGSYSATNAFTGISKNSFGFFFQPTGGLVPTYYTVDSLNPNNEARVLAYDGSDAGIRNSGILFAYEDGNDWDYQDAGFFVESITPVPEPGTMLLLGAGFLGFAIYGKRRKNA